ncbi:MAG TPA: HEPN domain-containing protein [Azospirillum sp.]|nr:HEPN domain-containing protein [Azospirillum sp.]
MADEYVRAWLKKVNDDLRAVRALPAVDDPVIAGATHHCQQAAEKLVKAVLVAAGRHPPKIHNILALVDSIPADHPLLPVLRPLERFTPYVALFRYPGAGDLFDDPPDEPTAAEVASWLAEIESVRAEVERVLIP